MNNLFQVKIFNNDFQKLATNFHCGNAYLDYFLRSPNALDSAFGKTYIMFYEGNEEIMRSCKNICSCGHPDFNEFLARDAILDSTNGNRKEGSNSMPSRKDDYGFLVTPGKEKEFFENINRNRLTKKFWNECAAIRKNINRPEVINQINALMDKED